MIHSYTLHGKNIILDVNSGSVHAVDPLVFHAIQHWDQVNQADFPDVQALIDAGKLFAPELPLHPESSRLHPVKAMCLHIAHSCNLTCDYCFANAGKFHGPEALMSFEVGRQALDFLIANSGTRRNLEVDFFGGEPLLNWEVVKRLVHYARTREAETNKRFRFTLTTNGVLVDDEVIAFCNREITNVVLSLDGRREVHDHLRTTVDGRGSYDIVVPKFQQFVKAREGRSYYMRGTFTHHNTDFLQDILHMNALGFQELSMEPVVCDAASPHALTQEDLTQVMREYEALALEMTRSGFSFYHYTLDLKHGPCFYKRVAGCGVGTEYLAVTPTGDFYPCHQFVGEPQFCMGSVREGITRPDLRDDFAACSLNAKPECRACWAKYYCAGGCPANAWHASGSIHGIYHDGCELFKKRMECAIWLYVTKALQKPAADCSAAGVNIHFDEDNVLPGLNQKTLKALNQKSKPVLLKKSVIDRNLDKHPDVGMNEYNYLLGQALYRDPSFFPGQKDGYVNLVTQLGVGRNALVLLEMSDKKDNFEIVHLMKINDNNLRRMKKRS